LTGEGFINESEINSDILKEVLGFEELNEDAIENTEQFES
jgi:hypothetical protein